VSGAPENPGAWLVTVGKRRWFDALRRKGTLEIKQPDLSRQAEVRQQLSGADFDEAEEEIGDDRLRLIFTACHPVLSREARVALTLRLVAGLTTEEIARAYLVREATVAQRVVRAKRDLLARLGRFEEARAELERAASLTRNEREHQLLVDRAARMPAAPK
jgi:RNA polymerase sigma factor (sigma-70 family)